MLLKSFHINNLCPLGGKDWTIVTLTVRVQAGARRQRVLGFSEGQLRVAVQAPPVEGSANRALVRLLAKALGVSRSRVRLVRGKKSRLKILEIEDLSPAELKGKLHELSTNTNRPGS